MKTNMFLVMGILLFVTTIFAQNNLPASWKVDGPDDPKDWEYSVSVHEQEVTIGVSRPDGGYSNGMYIFIPMKTDVYPGDRIYIEGNIDTKTRIPENFGACAGITVSAKNVFTMLDGGAYQEAREYFSLDTLSIEIWNCDIVSMSCSIIAVGIERDGKRYPFVFTNTTGIAETSPSPDGFVLAQNYPNPFNPTTTINYSVSTQASVTLTVFDMLGKEVANLVNEVKPAGNYSVNFNAANLPSGQYFYKLTNGSQVLTQKMLLIK